MRVLVLSTVFPNSMQPQFGVFVRERMARVAKHCETVVVAPVPWFAFNALYRGIESAAIPRFELQDQIPVYHPRVLSVPGILKFLDGILYFLSVLPLVWRLNREHPIDLIDVHFAYPDGVAGCLLAKVLRCPVVVTLRGTIGKLSKFRLRRFQIKWVLRAAMRVIAVSQSLKDVALRLEAVADKIKVVPNGVDTQMFNPSNREEARRKLGLSIDQKIIISVGALSERKGHHRVVEVMPRVLRELANTVYLVVGAGGVEGDMGPFINGLTQKLGIQGSVRLLCERPHHEIARWLAAADVFCLATSNEGMANVILEALACGVPVVATRVGGNVELIRDGENGYLVPLGDQEALGRALISALNNNWDREGIAAEIKPRSWDATAADLLNEFHKILSATYLHARTEGRVA
jgi:teichuronic acid biosynthesis glycosyltransferase TuaC